MLLSLIATVGLNFYLYIVHTEGLLPAAGYRSAAGRHARRRHEPRFNS
jgi:hypothetical protein